MSLRAAVLPGTVRLKPYQGRCVLFALPAVLGGEERSKLYHRRRLLRWLGLDTTDRFAYRLLDQHLLAMT